MFWDAGLGGRSAGDAGGGGRPAGSDWLLLWRESGNLEGTLNLGSGSQPGNRGMNSVAELAGAMILVVSESVGVSNDERTERANGQRQEKNQETG